MSDMLPQPLPNDPAPPLSDEEMRSQVRKGWMQGLMILTLFVSLIVGVFWWGRQIQTDQLTRRNLTEAINNLRQLGLSLFEFEIAYGSFPNDSTIDQVKGNYPDSTVPLGKTSSNDYFRQLIVAETTSDERIFYPRTKGSRKPDNVVTGSKALEKGECSFAYVIPTFPTNLNTPLVLSPVIPGTHLFDHELCRKLGIPGAVILRGNNSVSSYPVDKTGHVIIDGKDLFDPSQPFWNGKVPDVKWPE